MCESSVKQPLRLDLPLLTERRYGDTPDRGPHGAAEMNPDGRVAVCPGSYDPVTNGHVDIIARAARVFERVVVGVVNQPVRKSKTLFTAEERKGFILQATEKLPNVEVDVFDTLLVDFARKHGARALVKGLRAISDFEYEFEMNQLNRKLDPDIESVYLMASPEYSFLSSSGIQGAGHVRGGHRGPGAERGRQGLARSVVKGRRLETFGRQGRNLLARPGGPKVDVLVLIDKLDDLVHNAKPVPLTDQVRVDREEIYDLLDQMRATIPEEIKQARWIVKERQEMLAEAKRESERILKEARDQQQRLVSQEEITLQAERAAEEIVEDANARAREIRLGAEDYADEILNTLEVNLQKFLAAVQRGRDRLAGREQEPAEVG